MAQYRNWMQYELLTESGNLSENAMNITVEEINSRNILDINKCDNEFIIESKLKLRVENDEIKWTTIQIPPTRKRYKVDNVDYTTYIGNRDRVVFFAYVEGGIAGQVILRKNWNAYAYIEDLTVDVHYRRQGIGKHLISRTRQWTEEHRLSGIMLETQNNNVPACKFYEDCGFQLKGFDIYLYKGLDSSTDEIALYWYMIFDEVSPGHQI